MLCCVVSIGWWEYQLISFTWSISTHAYTMPYQNGKASIPTLGSIVDMATGKTLKSTGNYSYRWNDIYGAWNKDRKVFWHTCQHKMKFVLTFTKNDLTSAEIAMTLDFCSDVCQIKVGISCTGQHQKCSEKSDVQQLLLFCALYMTYR